MLSLIVTPLHVKGQEVIGVPEPTDEEIAYALRKIKGILWSTQHKLWYLPLTKDSYEALKQALSDKAVPDTSRLKLYLEQKRHMRPLPTRQRVIAGCTIQGSTCLRGNE